MSESSALRRMAAEIRFDDDRSGIEHVGDHAIHHYWPLIAPHFRDVLMSPQRRFDDGGVAWNWREIAESKPITVSELSEVRKRLTTANRAFAEGPDAVDDSSEGNAMATLEQVRDRMNHLTAGLIAKLDTELRGFVGRTESGPMVHSWGASTPAVPFNPDARECEISGAVIVGEEKAAGYEVVLENRKGLRIARQVSEAEGRFCFPNMGPGEYRVRVVSDRVRFPLSGLTVEVERSSITQLELKSTSSPDAPPEPDAPPAEPATTEKAAPIDKVDTPLRRPRRKMVMLLWILAGVLAIVAGVRVWKQKQTSAGSTEASRDSTANAAQSTPGKTSKKNPVSPSDTVSENSGGAHASANVRLEDDRMAAFSHSKKGKAASSELSTRSGEPENARVKSPDFSGFDLPSDPPSGAKSTSIKGPPRPSAGGLSRSPAQGSGTDGAPDPGKESAGQDGAKEGPSSSDQASPSASDSNMAASNAAIGKKLNASGPAPSATNSKNDASAATTADESQNNKPDLPAKPMPSPTASDPTTPKAPPTKTQTPEVPPPAPVAADKEKDKATDKTDDPVALDPKEKAKAPTPPKPKSAAAAPVPPPPANADKPADNSPPAGGVSNTASQLPPTKPKSSVAAAVPPTTPSDNAAATKGASANSDSSAPASKEGSAPSAAADQANRKSVKEGEKKPQTSPPPTPEETQSPGAVAESPATAAVHSADDLAANALSQRITVRTSPWELRLVDDSILPTQPVRIGEADTAEATRKQLLQERKAQLPGTLAHPLVRCGYAIDLPKGTGKAYWHALKESKAIATTLVGERAEIMWMGPLPPNEVEYRLSGEDGYELASFQVDAKGNTLVLTATHVRRHFWLGIERDSTDRAKITTTEWKTRFAWERLPGSSVQTNWRRDLSWLAGKGDRIDFSVDVGNGQPSLVWLSYVDHQTGWALLSEVEQTSGGSGAIK